MCCCGKPTINGTVGYRWNNPDAEPSVYPLNPPNLEQSDSLLFDEPGRCGGLDSHSHHYRVVEQHGTIWLLVRHGGGDERIRLSAPNQLIPITLVHLDPNARYWLLNAIFHAHSAGARDARFHEQERWRKAAIDKRIKVHKRKGTFHVSIEPKIEIMSA